MIGKIAKKILPQREVDRLKNVKTSPAGVAVHKWFERVKLAFSRPLLRWVTSSQWLSSVYYAFATRSFGREHRAVLYGRLMYMRETGISTKTQYLLRRNIHRLEKGLLMKPRRNVFALDYITETVDSFCRGFDTLQQDHKALPSEELQWAYDVLNNYFEAVGSHPTIDNARSQFEQCRFPDNLGEVKRVPYRRNLENNCPVTYESLLELAKRRRSVRWYLPKHVPRELIDQAVIVAAQSPSACNRQPFEFRIFDNPELVREIAQLPMGTAGYYHNIPAIAVVVGKLRAYFSERDRHIVYIDASLAAMSFMYALETLGLSSCSINWPDIEMREKKMAKILGLEFDERPIMLISIGYPDPEAMVAFSQKKELPNLRRYN